MDNYKVHIQTSKKCDYDPTNPPKDEKPEKERKEKIWTCKCNKEFNTKYSYKRHKDKCVKRLPREELEQRLIQAEEIPGPETKIGGNHQTTNAGRDVNNINTTGYIYLIQEREFVKSGEKTYKLGCTGRSPNDRTIKYPKGSILIMVSRVNDYKAAETKLIKKFTRKFDKQKKYGNEYFNGDIDTICVSFFKVAKKYSITF